MKCSRFFLILFLLAYLPGGWAQEISFHHLTTNEGLSNSTATSIYQDERGFIWVGTRDGVNQYNGNDFKVYKHQKDDPNTLIYNIVNQVTGNGKGEIYIQTSKGISAYDIAKDRFTTLIQENVNVMFYGQQLYIARKNSIYAYDGRKFVPFYDLPDKEAKITCLHIQRDSILIGTETQGLYVVGLKKQLTHPIKEGNISSVFKDNAGKYWIGSWEYGLFVMQGEQITNYQHVANNPLTISSNFVRRCCQDKEGNLWIGTFDGLNRFDQRTQTFTRYQKQDRSRVRSLTHSSIWALLCDRQGTIWVGTYFGGVNYFNPQNQKYTCYKVATTESEGLSSSIIGCMVEDKQKNLWICTEGGGLNKYNRTTGAITWYKNNGTVNSLSGNNIKSIYYDEDRETIWLGLHLGGLNKLELKSGQITRYKENSSPLSNIVRNIIPYHNQLLLATHNGVFLFDPSTGSYRKLFRGENNTPVIDFSSRLFIDHRGTLWIAGDTEGVYAYRFDTQKLKSYKYNHALEHSISSNIVNSIYEDSQKRLWFCTNESGLDLYRQETDDFENFDVQRNGLSNNVVHKICELSDNRYLVTTDNGFSRFDYRTKRFENYSKENGVPLMSINENALYKTSDGELFIGGVDGMISFREKEIDYVPRSYNILPYRLIVNGEEVLVNDESHTLTEALTHTRKVTLRAHQSMFSIEYALLDYIPSNTDEIVYRLEGFSKNWTSTRQQHIITYTNLSPGTYTLVVKAKENKLVTESRLEIEILPPFYRTMWAYLFYLVLFFAIVYYLIRIYHNRFMLQESLKYEKKRTQDIEALNQTKLRFFTNISHEFRTPLTLIIGQMEMLLQLRSFTPSIYNKIWSAYKNGLQLRELITELLDFRKQEQGYMSIKVSEQNIVNFVYENYLLFAEYAAQRHIAFHFHKTSDAITAWFDPKQIQKVINNLLSNALKHTKERGEISVFVRKAHREVIIEVTDNGCGIAPQDIDKIFDRFYQTEQMESATMVGTGIGLSLTKGIVELHHGAIEVSSDPGELTTFTVRLKLGNEHFDSKQFDCSVKEEIVASEPLNTPELSTLLMEQEMKDDESMKQESAFKILIVEDNEALRQMLAGIFDSYYTVITASDGQEGLDSVQSEYPNLVLSDVLMPKLSGTELCKAIKSNTETCHIPVVLLTARTAVEHNLKGLLVGADDYITKPFNVNILLSRCNNLVNSRVLLQEKFSKYPQVLPQQLATNPLDKQLLDKAMEVLEKHIDDVDFNVDIFASEIGIARTKLFTKLKAITGQTPAEFIVTVRLKQAAVMLKEHPELNVSEISDRLGFSSPRYFTKCFKEKYHIIPQVYRK